MMREALDKCEDRWKAELSPVIKGGPPVVGVIKEEVETFLKDNLL